MRGGEKILEVFCELYPDATLFTLLHNKGAMSPTIERMRIKNSFIQSLPMKATKYRNYLPLMPLAVGSLDFRGYDLIISTSAAVAKGARPRDGAVHICYCNSPMRYVWDQYEEYFGKGRAGLVTRSLMAVVAPFLRRWDVRTCSRVQYFIANSHNVAERISRIYHRSSDVIYPPVSTDQFAVSEKDDGYYLVVSALVPYKRVDLAIEVFNKSGEKLIIVGSGPERKKLENSANRNIEFLGWQSGEELAKRYAGCRALIFPGVEDFGIVPLEAMASGKPVVAYGEGGALETVVADGDSPTGVFFYQPTVDALTNAIKALAPLKLDPAAIRRHAEKFDRSIFKRQIREYIERRLKESMK
ncbi:MAG: glycosyltransferase family 4 protein [Ignavibacteriae bacterium]|nr:MAG: glycosyltransferase family 4 protein [Ignavibacteriota bacterium]